VVDTGAERLQVVCGAPNARAGMVGAFAPAGTVIPRSGLVLKKTVIRGAPSNGMLCSAFELMLSEDHEGIIELPPETVPGTALPQVLGLDDPVLDIKITPNRGDCLGVRGLARDLAAGGLGRLTALEAGAVPGRFASPIAVHLAGPDEKACPLFIGRYFRRLRNGASPAWLRERLAAIGLRPISALVDITNFLTFDLNRPLHVFDAGKLSGDLVVRGARAHEKLHALNGQTYELTPAMTVIADDAGPQSLGGVMGGEATGCGEATHSVFLEAALFDPVRTAETGRLLNIQSDARYRFERGLDPDFTRTGLEIATRLILELCGGEASEVVTAGQVPEWRRVLGFRPARVADLGGVAIEASQSRAILEALGCEVEPQVQSFAVTPPAWRSDLEGEADLVEEILRITGYDRIPAVALPRETVLPRPALNIIERRPGLVRRGLASRGMVEVVTPSFLPAAHAALFGDVPDGLRLVNPISADLDTMRPSILPNLLAAAERNQDRGTKDVAIFEIGPQYRDDTMAGQERMASGIRCGRTGPKRWNDPGRAVDAFLAKEDALFALHAAGVSADSVQVTTDPPGWYHPGRAGTLRQGPKRLGFFGELHPGLLAVLGMKGAAVGFEIFLDAVPAPRKGRARTPLALSALQPVERDFAFVVDDALSSEALLKVARGIDRKLVSEVRLFDVYAGEGLPPGTKSLAITLVLQPEGTSLTEPEIEALSQKLIAEVARALGGKLRQ